MKELEKHLVFLVKENNKKNGNWYIEEKIIIKTVKNIKEFENYLRVSKHFSKQVLSSRTEYLGMYPTKESAEVAKVVHRLAGHSDIEEDFIAYCRELVQIETGAKGYGEEDSD